MIRLVKGGLSIGVVINAVNLAMNGVLGATNERTLSNFMWFLIAYVIVDMIKDGMVAQFSSYVFKGAVIFTYSFFYGIIIV
jgi:hypothetical protein